MRTTRMRIANRQIRNSRAVALAAFVTASPCAAQPAPQPELVCDLSPILSGTMRGGALDQTGRGEPLRITFRDMAPKAGTAKMTVGEGASGEQPVGLAVENGALAFLAEKEHASKTMVTVQTSPTATGWPAVMSQHGWSGGELAVRAYTGACRLRS